MNQALLLAFVTAFVGISHPANAQNGQLYMTQSEPAPITASLDQRFKNCINEPYCPMQDRFQILMDINAGMETIIRKMNRTCSDMDYKDCVGVQANERRQWYNMYRQMSEIMNKIDPVYTGGKAQDTMDNSALNMSTQEPAAGNMTDDPVIDRSWWRNMRDNRHKPAAKND